jgi:calcineurin-like phosphoesterase family protein
MTTAHACCAAVLAIAAALPAAPRAGSPALPNRTASLKFAVIGDNGTGDEPQYAVARQMADARRRFAYDLVIMLGDNFYGSQGPGDLRRKFDLPYEPLLAAGVLFRAALGNHDDPRTVNYAPIGMAGQRYYTFVKDTVRFVVLDSNAMDKPQLAWFDQTLAAAREPWRIAYFHHPLYSNASAHGSSIDLRVLLEPLLVKYGVSAVFSGHDHSYERLTPQHGIQYFVCGAGGKLRKGGLIRSATTAAAFDSDQSFMLAEIAADEMFFETLSRAGAPVDTGVVRRRLTPRESTLEQ